MKGERSAQAKGGRATPQKKSERSRSGKSERSRQLKRQKAVKPRHLGQSLGPTKFTPKQLVFFDLVHIFSIIDAFEQRQLPVILRVFRLSHLCYRKGIVSFGGDVIGTKGFSLKDNQLLPLYNFPYKVEQGQRLTVPSVTIFLFIIFHWSKGRLRLTQCLT